MKLTVLQENLSEALSVASRFVSSRPQLPILSNFFLQADKNELKISATNLEIGINYHCGAKIEKEGKTTVLAKTFSEFVSSLPADKINLSLKKEVLKIDCHHFKADLPTTPVGNFPAISIKVSQKISLPYQTFSQAMAKVIFAASSDESRPVLSGVHFQFDGSQCLLSATDGYRLSFQKITLEKKYPKLDFIVPAVVLTELSRIKFGDKKEEFELGLSDEEKQAVFFLPRAEFTSRLLEGEYPKIEEIIPKDKKTTVIVDREEFLHLIRTAAIFARDAANIVKLDFNKNQVVISANAPSLGGSQNRMAVQIEGKDQKMAFNFHFLLDFLQAVDSDEIQIELNESTKPVVFKLPQEKEFLHIIMPVRLQEEA